MLFFFLTPGFILSDRLFKPIEHGHSPEESGGQKEEEQSGMATVSHFLIFLSLFHNQNVHAKQKTLKANQCHAPLKTPN